MFFKKIDKQIRRLTFHNAFQKERSLNNRSVDLHAFPWAGKACNNKIDFVCPFHRGDVLLGLNVACTAAIYGKKIRMYVSKDIYPWISAVKYDKYIEVIPINIPVPKAKDTQCILAQALDEVISREDFSGHLACSHPRQSLEKRGLDLVENMLKELEMPIDTKLVKLEIENGKHDNCDNYNNTVLIHPMGGWDLKSMSEEIVKQIQSIVHTKGLKLIQIGGKDDKRFWNVDGYILDDLSLSSWKEIFINSVVVISVDSWTAHFGSMINANQIIIYGSTNSMYVESKRHFEEQNGEHLSLNSTCKLAPCNSLTCKLGYSYCLGMRIESKKISDFLEKVTGQ